MSLIRWKPLQELDTLRHQMNHLFGELMHGDDPLSVVDPREFNQFSELANALWAPAIELKETDTALILKAAVPGIDAKELDIHVSERAVSIAGKYHEEKQTETQGYYHSELQHGQFRRTVPLPLRVQPDHVYAECVKGVLTLTLPKSELSSQKVTQVDLTQAAPNPQAQATPDRRAATANGLPNATKELTPV